MSINKPTNGPVGLNIALGIYKNKTSFLSLDAFSKGEVHVYHIHLSILANS